jgi:hypothetical protein
MSPLAVRWGQVGSGAYRRGFYFSDSMRYANNHFSHREHSALLLCKVLVGKDKLIPLAKTTPT